MSLPRDLHDPVRHVLVALDHGLRTLDEDTVHDLALADELDEATQRYGPELVADAAANVLIAAALRALRSGNPRLPEAVSALRGEPLHREVAHHAELAADALHLLQRYSAESLSVTVMRAELAAGLLARANGDPMTATWYAFNAATILCSLHDTCQGAEHDLPEHHVVRDHIESVAALMGVQAPPSVV